MDMNDQTLRSDRDRTGGKTNGVPREDGFNILLLQRSWPSWYVAKKRTDLKQRLGNIYIGQTYDREPVFARDLKAESAMAILLKMPSKPNLVQTRRQSCHHHGGPFANIAQGTNTILATKMGLSLGDYVVTEAGFGADLGAEIHEHQVRIRRFRSRCHRDRSHHPCPSSPWRNKKKITIPPAWSGCERFREPAEAYRELR